MSVIEREEIQEAKGGKKQNDQKWGRCVCACVWGVIQKEKDAH